MRGFHSSSFDPETFVVLEAPFDEAWLTLKAVATARCSRTNWPARCCGLPWRANATRFASTTER
jgi:hypothetical protein